MTKIVLGSVAALVSTHSVFAGGGGGGTPLCKNTPIVVYKTCTITSLSFFDRAAANIDPIAKHSFNEFVQIGNQFAALGCHGLTDYGTLKHPGSTAPAFLYAYSRTGFNLFQPVTSGFGINSHFPLVSSILIEFNEGNLTFFQHVVNSMNSPQQLQKVAIANCQSEVESD